MSAHTPGDWKAVKPTRNYEHETYEIHWSDIGECVAEIVMEQQTPASYPLALIYSPRVRRL